VSFFVKFFSHIFALETVLGPSIKGGYGTMSHGEGGGLKYAKKSVAFYLKDPLVGKSVETLLTTGIIKNCVTSFINDPTFKQFR